MMYPYQLHPWGRFLRAQLLQPVQNLLAWDARVGQFVEIGQRVEFGAYLCAHHLLHLGVLGFEPLLDGGDALRDLLHSARRLLPHPLETHSGWIVPCWGVAKCLCGELSTDGNCRPP